MISGYETIKEIGRGSFGKVHLATHKQTGENVAVKTIYKEKYEKLQFQYPPREIAILKCLSHPQIAQVYEIIERKDRIHIVMEYVQGNALVEVIPEGGLSENVSRKLFRQILLGVEYIHSKGIVHRDLKLDNILLSKSSLENEHGGVKIIDFGLSNSFSPNELLKTFCGTTQYAAPELLNGKKYFGPKVDVWSLGVLLYTLIVGNFPFQSAIDTLECKYHIPQYFSQSLQHLLSSIFEINPKNRISIKNILKHPWVNKRFSSPPKQITTVNRSSLEPKLLNYLKNQNLGYNNLESSILELSSASSMYYLTLRKLSRLSRYPYLASSQTSPSDPFSYFSLSSLLPSSPPAEEIIENRAQCVIC